MQRKNSHDLLHILASAILIGVCWISVTPRSLSRDIPEAVAYEAFLTLVGQPNAAEWLRKGGFDDMEIERLVSEGQSWLSGTELWRKSVHEIRADTNLSPDEITTRIARVNGSRSDILDRTIQRYLPQNMQGKKDRIDLLKAFIDSRVRARMESFNVKGQIVYGYSAAWDHDGLVYGTVGLIVNYSDETTYSISNKINGPSSSYSSMTTLFTVVPSTALNKLKLGSDDGVYSLKGEITAHDGSIRWTVGEVRASHDVMPQVFIQDVKLSQPQVEEGQTIRVEVKMGSTKGVPPNTPISVEFFELSFPGNRPEYSVVDGRTRSIIIDSPATAKSIVFPLEFTKIPETGEMKKRLRIYKAPDGLKIQSHVDTSYRLISP